MPNYTLSDLVKSQGMLNASFASAEKRFRDPVVWNTFFSKKGFLQQPNFQALRTREDKPPTDAIFNTRTARALGTARSHNHTGTKGDSAVFNLSWLERTDEFTISLKQGGNNVENRAMMLTNEIENVIANFSEGHETIAANFLFNNRSQVSNAVAESAFDGVTFVNEIAVAKENRAAQITKTAMKENKYRQGLQYVFCDSISFNKFEFNQAQGAGNNENLQFQYGNQVFIESIEMNALASVLGYTQGFWISVQDGLFGAVDWIPQENRTGVTTSVNMYGTLINPTDGLTYAVHSYETRADDSANNGYTQDVVTQVQVSIDHALALSPSTTANETVAQAFAII